MEPENKELILEARYEAFDTTVEIIFVGTKYDISECQKGNYEAFIARQELLTPEIMKAIFQYYQEAYDDYKDGWEIIKEMHPDANVSEEDAQKILPIPTNPENLKKHIAPLCVYIPSAKDCTEGTIGIAFTCTWDANELGVRINNWKDIEVGTQDIAFFY